MRPVLAALVAVLVLVLALPGAASALPGDPPVVAQSPADGATVQVSPDGATGIGVSFTCPKYVQQRYGFDDNMFTDVGDSEDYGVRFSGSPALGSDGLLATQLYSGGGGARPVAGTDTCTGELDADYVPKAIGLGRIYWQAYRSCIGCEGQRPESSPVRSFVVSSAIKASLVLPTRLYAGYLGVFKVRSAAKLGDARVTLERRAGSKWRAVTDHPAGSDETVLVGRLPAGKQTVRAVVTIGSSRTVVATRQLTVRRERSRSTSRGDDGSYADVKPAKNSTLKFTVSGGGRTLRGFKASVTTFCFGPSASDNRIFVAFALLNTVRVAPDGAVVGLLETKSGSREILTGRLRHGRLSGAAIDVTLSVCSGTRKFSAKRS